MPFEKTPIRGKEELTAFFEDQIKKPIEEGDFLNKYIVHRSDDAFNITEKIITDIFNAYIVICDLSGIESNPNVMYELGMRLTLNNNPVILIREENKENKPIFDISGFYAHPYNPLNYKNLLLHISEKIKKFETGIEKYESPVLKVIRPEHPLLQKMVKDRAHYLLLTMNNSVLYLNTMFAGLLRTYLEQNNFKFSGENFPVNELYLKIKAEYEKFSKIDFSGFDFEFSSLPTIDFYLANQYLTDIVEGVLITRFSVYVNCYHLAFLGTNITYRQWSANNILSFCFETQIFIKLTEAIIRILRAESDEDLERSNILFYDLLSRSQLQNANMPWD